MPVVLAAMLLLALLAGCASRPDGGKTIEQLRGVKPDMTEVAIDDSLNKALASYRHFLNETPVNNKTPDAMRRLADLQIEKEYGVIGDGSGVTLAAPARLAMEDAVGASTEGDAAIADHSEPEAEFERRATAPLALPSANWARAAEAGLPDGLSAAATAGPLEAIATYQKILDRYPYYERNDQVLYQMARAYDELGEPDKAMEVMDWFINDYRYSHYADEVYFRRAEYFFVRKQYLEAEEAYSAVVSIGSGSQFYELALYKLGWTFYKQDFYEEALHRFMALLDYKQSMGYDFDRVLAEQTSDPDGAGDEEAAEDGDLDGQTGAAVAAVDVPAADATGEAEPDEDDDRRVADTFRVVSLSFSNLGGPQVINEYYATYGNRSYEDRIYSNLGEFFLSKLRYNDAAKVYRSFTELHPFHRIAPHFSMRVVEIYAKGDFGQLVVEAKKDFARRYGLNAEYWQHAEIEKSPDVLSYLKTNLKDLASHYHALYQMEELEKERPGNYAEALTWYRELLASFPTDDDSAATNYQLADLQFENGDFTEAAVEYERTAYDYPAHEKASAAGYAAVYAHREHLKSIEAPPESELRVAAVDSTMRFVDAFPAHDQAATVLGAATEDLYQMKRFEPAITAGRRLIESYPSAGEPLHLSAWTVVAHASFDLAVYPDAEQAYAEVLALTPEADEGRQELFENLAASIYKQGEAASAMDDHRAAADHFLRVRTAAPTSAFRPAAEYDAASALMKLESWAEASAVFRDFRAAHEDHELQPEVTKQLAFVYRQAGELTRSAEEYERVAADALADGDETLRRESTLLAAELYEEAGSPKALAAFQHYVETFPEPMELAVEVRFKIAGMHKADGDEAAYSGELRQIVAIDADAGAARTPRIRYLAAQSALVLTEERFTHFTELRLSQPFEKSLAEKRKRMDAAMSAYEALVDYEVADVTAAATYYMAEMYGHFGESLLSSERPKDLNEEELAEYELILEEEAFPFEESAIEVHEKNIELMVAGTFNTWIEQSLGQLSQLMPGRYAKSEISTGFVGPVEAYAYRTPVPIPAEETEDVSAAF
jgi:tetratricopeptide (TPR) repeat protein